MMTNRELIRPNSFTVYPRNSGPMKLRSYDEKREIAEIVSSREELVSNSKARFHIGRLKVDSIDMVRVISKFKSFTDSKMKLTAIQVYKFARFPVSVILVVPHNGVISIGNEDLQDALSSVIQDDKTVDLALEVPKNIYKTIVNYCLKRDGHVAKEKKTENYPKEVYFTEQMVVRKSFSVIVFDEDNQILARGDIYDPNKYIDGLKNMIRSSIPHERTSLLKSVLMRAVGFGADEPLPSKPSQRIESNQKEVDDDERQEPCGEMVSEDGDSVPETPETENEVFNTDYMKNDMSNVQSRLHQRRMALTEDEITEQLKPNLFTVTAEVHEEDCDSEEPDEDKVKFIHLKTIDSDCEYDSEDYMSTIVEKPKVKFMPKAVMYDHREETDRSRTRGASETGSFGYSRTAPIAVPLKKDEDDNMRGRKLTFHELQKKMMGEVAPDIPRVVLPQHAGYRS